jgi:hypothetical protein
MHELVAWFNPSFLLAMNHIPQTCKYERISYHNQHITISILMQRGNITKQDSLRLIICLIARGYLGWDSNFNLLYCSKG